MTITVTSKELRTLSLLVAKRGFSPKASPWGIPEYISLVRGKLMTRISVGLPILMHSVDLPVRTHTCL